MSYFIIIGAVLSAWSVLLVFSGERQRQLNEIEIQNQVNAAAAEEEARNSRLPPHKRKKRK